MLAPGTLQLFDDISFNIARRIVLRQQRSGAGPEGVRPVPVSWMARPRNSSWRPSNSALKPLAETPRAGQEAVVTIIHPRLEQKRLVDMAAICFTPAAKILNANRQALTGHGLAHSSREGPHT